jgi:hypothetical protein
MATILRCPRCRTFVYDHASRCHGCDGALRRRDLIGKWGWIFVLLCTAGYAGVRSVALHRQTERRQAREAADARRAEIARELTAAWLSAPHGTWQAAWRERLEPGAASSFLRELRQVRDRFCEALPADAPPSAVRSEPRNVMVARYPDGRTTVDVAVLDLPAPQACGTTSDACATVEAGAANPYGCDVFAATAPTDGRAFAMSSQNGGPWTPVPHRWWESSYEFEWTFARDGREYRAFAAVHLDSEARVSAFRLGRVEDANSGEAIRP